MQLSIVIPTFNERDNVRILYERITSTLSGANLAPSAYEIWFVDDSTDDTPLVIDELQRAHANVHLFHRTGERGLGTAVVEGFRRSCGAYVIVMDADLQHPPELLPTMLQRLQEGSDIVIPSRFVPGGSDGGLNQIRKLVSWTARGIGRLAIRRLRQVSDCTAGYFGLRRCVIEGVHLEPIGWKILIEVLVRGQYGNVHEIPYEFVARDAGESKMNLREQWNYIRHIWRLVWTSPDDRRFYVFCFVGALGTVVNIAVMSLLVYGFHIHGLTASVIASLVAMVHNFLWNDKVTWRGYAHPTRWRRVLQAPVFMVVSAVSVVVTALFVQMALWLHINEIAGQFVGIGVATVWSFLANNRWTWSTRSDGLERKLVNRISVTKEKPQHNGGSS